jgi:hypothetical protein
MPQKLTQAQFIARAIAVHGGRYDYSQVEYINASLKVTLICPQHGEFKQAPANHANGQGCMECSFAKRSVSCRLGTDTFVAKARAVHGDKYDYSLVSYTYNRTKVFIICSTHGPFEQKPDAHLRGRGCKRCADEQTGRARLLYDTEGFIKQARAIHGDRYDYRHAALHMASLSKGHRYTFTKREDVVNAQR